MKFIYDTGIRRRLFENVRLRGSWDAQGRFSEEWSEVPMRACVGADGACLFDADVELDPSQAGTEFHWTVLVDGALGLDREGIVTEQRGQGHAALHRSFTLTAEPNGIERYYLTHVRRLGARKLHAEAGAEPGLRFAVWAPNARSVEVVFGDAKVGYIADDGTGVDPSRPVIPLRRGADGVWSAGPKERPELARFRDFGGAAYMYRICREDGSVAYRTDLHSRS